MIARLHGKVLEKKLQSIVLDVHGVGFELLVPLSTSEALEAGAEVSLLTHLHVREDALQLYGFLTEAERELFLHLISVSGIGPRVALNLLSARGVEVLREAIVSGDLAALTAISGVGRKTAERIVVELREKLGGRAEKVVPTPSRLPEEAEEAVLALTSLGFQRREAEHAVLRVLGEEKRQLAADELVRLALKQL